jgi:hypothetical protein
MEPSKDAGRPSCLVVQPDNLALSVQHRIALVASFDALPEDAKADLLEFIESWVHRQSAEMDTDRRDTSLIVHQMYANARWECSHN